MKIGKSIFSKLMGSFAIFGILLIFTLFIALFVNVFLLGGGNVESLYPYGIVDEAGNVKDTSGLTKLGGWIEEIEEIEPMQEDLPYTYFVSASYGEPAVKHEYYTADDILNLTSYYGDGDHMAYFFERGGKCFLCIYRRENAQQPTLVLNSQGRSFWGVFLVLIVLEIVFFSLYLRHKIKRPLSKIVEGMERLKSGDGSARITIKTEAEFRTIVDGFNSMADELEKEKEEKAEIISRRNMLMLQLSHDIKTPIATIKSNASALREGLVKEEDKDRYLEIIDKKSDRVSLLAEDMFMMLKMDNPDYQIQKSKEDLGEILRRICSEYYDEISDAGFEFDIDIPEDPMPVMLDEHLFSRVVINLLSNAEKYNKTGHRIGLSCYQKDERYHIEVSDDGEPIDKELADKMFEVFERGDKTRKSDGGTGLGLAISRLITVKHGGSLNYHYKDGNNVFEMIL